MLMMTLTRTICRWLRSDRIRIAPSDGTLYRLPPRSILLFAGRTLEVLDHRVESGVAGPVITYDCTSGGLPCQLRVAVGSSQLALVEQNRRETLLTADDVEVFHV